MTISVSLLAEERIFLFRSIYFVYWSLIPFCAKLSPPNIEQGLSQDWPLRKLDFLLSWMYLFFLLCPYSLPYNFDVYCLLVFILIFILLGVIMVHQPPDQMHYCNLCASFIKNIWWGFVRKIWGLRVPRTKKSCMLLRSGFPLCLLPWLPLPPAVQLPAY